MPKITSKIVNAIGLLLTILSIWFVIDRSKFYLTQLPADIVSTPLITLVAGLGCIYAAAEILLVQAWKVLAASRGLEIDFRSAFIIWGRSQIAKYIPGNIFHVASKQIYLTQKGLSQKDAGLVNITELVLLAASAVLFGWWVLPALIPKFTIASALVCWFVSVSLIFLFLFHFRKNLIKVWLPHSIFLAITGLIYFILSLFFRAGIEPNFNNLFTTTGTYIISWLVGFITPGSPAGIGIRESVLFFLEKGLPIETILLSSLGTRIVSIIGDLLLLIVSFLWRKDKWMP